MKLLWGKWRKVTKPDFRKKISFWLFWHFHSQNSQKSRFLPLRENASLDFAHFAHLDRSHRYLQLFYWHQVLEKSSRPSRCHFRPKNQKIRFRIGSKIENFQKKFFFCSFQLQTKKIEKTKIFEYFRFLTRAGTGFFGFWA